MGCFVSAGSFVEEPRRTGGFPELRFGVPQTLLSYVATTFCGNTSKNKVPCAIVVCKCIRNVLRDDCVHLDYVDTRCAKR